MEGKTQRGGWASFFSGLAVWAAFVLLFMVCSYCYPSVQTRVREVLSGLEDGAVRQAFGTLAEGLESGEPVRETVTQTVQVLFGETG